MKFHEAVLIELEAFIPYFKIDCEEIISLLFFQHTWNNFPTFMNRLCTGPSERLSAETPRVLGWCHSRSCFRNFLSDFKEELSDWATSLIYLWKFIVLPLHLSCTCVHTYLGQLQGLRNSPLPGFSPSHLLSLFVFPQLVLLELYLLTFARCFLPLLHFPCFAAEVHCIMSAFRDIKWHYPTSLCSVHAKAAYKVWRGPGVNPLSLFGSRWLEPRRSCWPQR